MKSDTSHMGGVRRHVVWKLFGGVGRWRRERGWKKAIYVYQMISVSPLLI